ncbi:unnamed protein product [Larinioides sclopetarius]|uniref:Uncharacterized protein n=1 Tax=Larinioides sclopetarius TaxID=280406 RepID=A0AAV2ACU7_9ARAC
MFVKCATKDFQGLIPLKII